MCFSSYHLFHVAGVTRVGVDWTKRMPRCGGSSLLAMFEADLSSLNYNTDEFLVLPKRKPEKLCALFSYIWKDKWGSRESRTGLYICMWSRFLFSFQLFLAFVEFSMNGLGT